MSDQLTIFLLSTIPVGELRLTIPLALEKFGFSFWLAMVLSVAGVMFAVIIIFLLIGPAVKLLRKIKIFDRLITWLFNKTRQKHNQKMKTWGNVALVVISAIPIPVVGGAWTAALVAYIFNLPKLLAGFLILIGTIISGFIILGLSEGISSII